MKTTSASKITQIKRKRKKIRKDKRDHLFFKGYKINRKSEQKLFIIVFIGMDLKIVYHVLKLTTKKVVGNDNESIYLEPAVFGHVKRDE